MPGSRHCLLHQIPRTTTLGLIKGRSSAAPHLSMQQALNIQAKNGKGKHDLSPAQLSSFPWSTIKDLLGQRLYLGHVF